VQFKDLFSRHASDYARFRPRYPADLFAWLADVAPARELAVDVGAGNGQAASALARHFAHVVAVEPSAQQIASSAPAAGVSFVQGSASAFGVPAGAADLVVSAQAFHWFDQKAFFAEVRRVACPSGCLAVWCYGLTKIAPAIDRLVYQLYETRLGRYWDPERKLVETGYRDVEFPFAEIEAPAFEMRLDWTFEHLIGYLGTWSALKRHIEREGTNPLEEMLPRLQSAWATDGERPVTWPISLRAFRL
jgi:SAM-dependent methyltransferase